MERKLPFCNDSIGDYSTPPLQVFIEVISFKYLTLSLICIIPMLIPIFFTFRNKRFALVSLLVYIFYILFIIFQLSCD